MGRKPKDKKAARVDSGKARQADYDRAILECKRTEPPYKYTELCPVEEYYGKNQITKSELSMNIWFELIGDLDFETCKSTVKQLMVTLKFFPSAAEIREACADNEGADVLGVDDAWGIVLRAIRTYGYMREAEALESLPEPCRGVVRNMGWQNLCQSENIMAERAFFRDSYKPKMEGIRQNRTLPRVMQENRKRLDEQIGEALKGLTLGYDNDGDPGTGSGRAGTL